MHLISADSFVSCKTYIVIITMMFVISWVGLVTKNYEIERACAELEAENERLKQQN